MRFLMQMGYDNSCFAAAVLSLAVKGHLRIEQDAGVLGLGKTFTLVKQSSPDAKPPSADEDQLLVNIFSEGNTLKLQEENYERVSEARTNHRLSLKDRYTSAFFNINGGWHFLGIVLSILLALPALFLPGKTDLWPEWHFTTPAGWFTLFTVLLMLVANGVFGKLLRAHEGTSAATHTAALRVLSTGGSGTGHRTALGRAVCRRAQRAGARLRARVVRRSGMEHPGYGQLFLKSRHRADQRHFLILHGSRVELRWRWRRFLGRGWRRWWWGRLVVCATDSPTRRYR